ncbi:hypothetical protein [uncultured Roseobacter sp.]|uniref:hypothetical protein n=1 Tax=uncultured Roseobacter sp. TaxID=114847 RepID=UPI002611FCAE|nr:hypothetical protein [uncultured Roseobacter sp.]
MDMMTLTVRYQVSDRPQIAEVKIDHPLAIVIMGTTIWVIDLAAWACLQCQVIATVEKVVPVVPRGARAMRFTTRIPEVGMGATAEIKVRMEKTMA